MSFLNRAFKFSILILLISISYKYYRLYADEYLRRSIEEWANRTQLVLKNSTGDESSSSSASTVAVRLETFEVEYNELEWLNLLDKLSHTRFFEKMDENYVKANEYGFESEYAKELGNYWRTKFNWKERVNLLNKFKQYRLILNDNATTLHFVRVKIGRSSSNDRNTGDSASVSSIKLMLIDGWPGSFYGFYKLLDKLSENYAVQQNVELDIIVPSLPGFGYSTPLKRPLDTCDTAQLFDALMRYVHDDENCNYLIHGEDWGAIVATVMAQLYPKRVSGIHLTMTVDPEPFDVYNLFYTILAYLAPSSIYTKEEIANNVPAKSSIVNRLRYLVKEFGYLHIQATYPDTIGHALTDSPVGLMAYLLEKYSKWSFDYETSILGKPDGGLSTKFIPDDLLTIVTIYWMSNSITSSMRFYKASIGESAGPFPKPLLASAKVSAQVKVAVQSFKHSLFSEASFFVKLKYENLVKFKLETDGGHFASFESPTKTTNDLIEFIHLVYPNTTTPTPTSTNNTSINNEHNHHLHHHNNDNKGED